jgi:hypothetical protein
MSQTVRLMLNSSVTVAPYTAVSRESSTLCREHKWRLKANKSYVVNLFNVSTLSRVPHDKLFTESKSVFAVRNRLMTKPVIPVFIHP